MENVSQKRLSYTSLLKIRWPNNKLSVTYFQELFYNFISEYFSNRVESLVLQKL